MTQIRSIAADELPAFISLSEPEHADAQSAYVTDLIARGAMRPGWCFVAEDRGRVVGRYAFWNLPKFDTPDSIVLVEAASDQNARDLLAHAIAGAREAASKSLIYVLDDPPQWPQWQTDLERRAAWFEAAGFCMRRATARFELKPGDPGPSEATASPAPPRLRYEPIDDVGEAAFLDAIERVSAGSFDQYTIDERERLGPEGEARQTLDELRSMTYEPSWWALAFDADDHLVGLIMPTGAPSFVTIGYIGVVPEQRGHGYVNDLLARGTATLRRIAAESVIRADTDVSNAPMAAAFERAGYSRFATRREYELRL
jgi:RimJ/RimL family protein N-acetyltransferase